METKNTLSGDIMYVFGVGLNSYAKKCEQAAKKIEQLLTRIDEVLDKSLDENRPQYACGNALEDIKEVLEDTAKQISHTRNLVAANCLAWEDFSGESDEEENRRHGFVHGFMTALKREDK